MRYHRLLMQSIFADKAHIADAVNATMIPLSEAPRGHADFDSAVARKFVLDPHGLLS